MDEIFTLEGFAFRDSKAHERIDSLEEAKGKTNLRINTLEESLEDIVAFSPFVTKDYFYLDGVNGNDENDGLTADTAFKTFERALKVHEMGTLDLRVTIISPGSYRMPYDTYNSLSWHIRGEVDGIILDFDSKGKDVSFYGEHYNLIKVTLKNAGEIRFEGCTIGLDTVVFDATRLKMHDCYIDCATTATFPEIAFYACRGRIRRIVSTSQAEYAVIMHKGCNIRLYNQVTFATQTTPDVNTAIYIMDGCLWCDWSVVNGSGFLNAIKAESAVVALSRERHAMLTTLGTTTLKTDDALPCLFINSTMYTGGEY